MHTYNPRTDWIPPYISSEMSRRMRLYVMVRRTYDRGHYDFAQALYHLLEDGIDTDTCGRYWEHIKAENPSITCQQSSGCSVYAMRG